VGSVAELAQDLAPSVLVLEDVDLVAEGRTFGMSSNPVLFDLLDAMDGAAPDADLLFLLTTNQVQRPDDGRCVSCLKLQKRWLTSGHPAPRRDIRKQG
jgi:SpoVK/Ycf46/Vps4 family AAA+-type ATPase